MKLEWGKKISCPACAMKMYDLMRSEIICPYCGNKFEENDVKSSRKKNTTAIVNEALKTSINFDFSDEEVNIEEDTNNDEVIEEDIVDLDSEIDDDVTQIDNLD